MLRRWRNNNPELVRAQKRCYYERKVGPRVPRTQQRKEKDDEYDSNEILQDLFCVMLTDFRRPPPLPSPPPLPPLPPPPALPPPSSRQCPRK